MLDKLKGDVHGIEFTKFGQNWIMFPRDREDTQLVNLQIQM